MSTAAAAAIAASNPNNRKPRSLTLVHEDMLTLEDLLLNIGGDVTEESVAEAVDAWLEEIKTNQEAATDRYVGLINEMETRAKARKDEAKRLEELAATDVSAAERLRARLKWFFDQHNISKVKTVRFQVTVQKNGGVHPMEIVSEADIPDDYVEYIRTPRKDKIREALVAGTPVEGAKLLERGTSLRIK